jgi:hypothetical protein
MANMNTQYAGELLSVDPTTVTEGELRDAYRSLLKAHHPDLGGDEERELREEMTRRVNAAYRWLALAIEARDEARRTAETTQMFTDAGWTYSEVRPDWWPKEDPPTEGEWRTRKNSRRSKPTQRTSIYPSVARQRGTILLVGAVALLTGAAWYDAIGWMLTALILFSLLVGRPLEVFNDLVAPIERLLRSK